LKYARVVGCLALAMAALTPAAAKAQYVAPPPAPGFHYIFDGTATGSDASFDKWKFATGTFSQSAPAAQGGQGQASLDTTEGSFKVGASPFGSYWYPVKPFGDVVYKIQFTVENSPTSTRNGGIMIRTPEVRYSCPDANGAPANCSTANNNAATLALKPQGFNYGVCPGVINPAIGNPLCTMTTPAASQTYTWGGSIGAFPPAGTYQGGYCARQTAAGVYDVNGLNGQPLTVNGNANNHQHWTQVYCGHEIQINESLTGTCALCGSDPIKTGSVYGFRNLNAQQSGTYKRLTKGVWHSYEIRTIGQQYTILIDGELINQFDNAIPKIASRAGDPPTMARQLTQGYLGLQTHGGNDRISYREIQVKEFQPSDLPVNTVAPSVSGSGLQDEPLTCNRGTWNAAPGSTTFYRWYRANKIAADNPRRRAPSQLDYGNFTNPLDPNGTYGNQPETVLDSLIVGTEQTYTPTAADVGKNIYCTVNVDNAGATVWKYGAAPEILSATHAPGGAGGTVPATLALTLGPAGSFGSFQAGVARDYTSSMTATVTSSAGNAALIVQDASPFYTNHLVNGSFALSQELQVKNNSGAYQTMPAGLRFWGGPTASESVPIDFKQSITANEPLRTGAYNKTLTFTLSTTEP
jgi:Domain of Unknown Function (DUF1080)